MAKKKMIVFESVQVVTAFRKKYPDPERSLDDFDGMRGELAGLIKASGVKRKEIAKAIGLNEHAIFTRMRNPDLWSSVETRKLLMFFGFIEK